MPVKDTQFQEDGKDFFQSFETESQSEFKSASESESEFKSKLESKFESFLKGKVLTAITAMKQKNAKSRTERDVQPILTRLTLGAFRKFAQLNSFDLSQLGEGPTIQLSELNTFFADGNTATSSMILSQPDSVIAFKTNNFTHPLLIGEAKKDRDLKIPRDEAFFKGSFVSPLFGYMSIYIIINHQHVEIGLFSPLYNAPTKDDADTIICSHKFALTEESLNPMDPGDPDIFLYLDSLVQILFQFYQHFSLKLKMTQFTRFQPNSILRTYLLHVTGFSLPKDGSIFKIELPTTTSTTSITSTWKTDLNTSLTSYMETLSKIPSDKPHLLKRALLTDRKGTCHTNLLKYGNCNPFSSGLERLYLLGPPIAYEAAAHGVIPDLTESTITNSSIVQSPSTQPLQSSKSTQLSPSLSKVQSQSPTIKSTAKSTIYFTIISVNCSDELIFKKWGEEVMSNTHFNLDHFKQVLGVVQALHRCGFIHCDIRSPNLVLTLENPTDPISNMSLVDMEYVHCIKDQNSTFEPVKLYNTLRSVQYLEWFLGKSNQLRFDLMAQYVSHGNLELAQAVPATIPPELFQPQWTPNWFRLLDYYNLIRSFFEKDIAKWDTDSNTVRGSDRSLDTMVATTPLSQFIIATATFLLKMMSKNLPALGQGVQIDPKLDDDVIEWADKLFAALQAAFDPATAQTVDVVANKLVITTKPTDDDDILPSPKENDDSNVVDHTNNLIVSPEGP